MKTQSLNRSFFRADLDASVSAEAVDKSRAANQKPLKKSLWQPYRVPEGKFLISFFMIALYFPPTTCSFFRYVICNVRQYNLDIM